MNKKTLQIEKEQWNLNSPTVGQVIDALNELPKDMPLLFVSNKQINTDGTYQDDYETFITTKAEIFHSRHAEDRVFLNLYSEEIYDVNKEYNWHPITDREIEDYRNAELDPVIGEVIKCYKRYLKESFKLVEKADSSNEALIKFEKSVRKRDLLERAIQALMFLNNAMKRKDSDMLSVLFAMDEEASIHYEHKGNLIHVKIYHKVAHRYVLEFDLERVREADHFFIKNMTTL